ncbi:MAG: ACT domain-containing protein [Anaerolineales bacterium]|nr:ACT domain-containing protein [Anaerolineales bacterium]
MTFELFLFPGEYIVCQLPPDAPVPAWGQGENLLAFIRTPDELTVVCEEVNIPTDVRAEPGWRVLKVAGPLEFSMVGVLASLSGVLAQAGASIFALSTFDTDYLLVKAAQLEAAIQALENAGHTVDHL